MIQRDAVDSATPPMLPVRPSLVRPRVLDPKQPALWLMVGMVAVGAWQLGAMSHEAIAAYPLPALVALLLFGVYAVPFVLVVRSLDYLEQEPTILLAMAFVWGGVVATSQAIPANQAVREIVAKLVTPAFADAWAPAISAPAVEETLKTLGIIAIVLLARAHINSALDGFVYGAMVGLGFQVVENFVYAVNAVIAADNSGDADWFGPLFATFLARGFLAGLWSHTMFSALTGAGIGYAVMRTERSRSHRIGVAALAFAGAWLFHFVWDTPLLMDGSGLGTGGVLAALVLKGLPGLVVVLYLASAAMRREIAYYSDLLTLVNDSRLITADEAKALVRGRTRLAARRHARSLGGLRAAVAVRRLQRTQARFIVELSRSLDGRDPASREASPKETADRRTTVLVRRRHEVLDARERLRALGFEHVNAPEPPQHSALGLLSIVLGLVGVFVPVAAVAAIGLAGAGLLSARRRREVADSWFTDGLIVGSVSLGLWLVSRAISAWGGL